MPSCIGRHYLVTDVLIKPLLCRSTSVRPHNGHGRDHEIVRMSVVL
jgi:hypothetical protein